MRAAVDNPTKAVKAPHKKITNEVFIAFNLGFEEKLNHKTRGSGFYITDIRITIGTIRNRRMTTTFNRYASVRF